MDETDHRIFEIAAIDAVCTVRYSTTCKYTLYYDLLALD